jgi:hypothetical protein
MRRPPRRLLPLLALCLLVVGLSGASIHDARPLSQRIVAVNVTRTGAFPGWSETALVVGPLAQALFDDAHRLRVTTDGIVSCPADFGIRYQMVFLRSDGSRVWMALSPTGCQLVTQTEPPARARWADQPYLDLFSVVTGVWPLTRAW